MPAKPQSPALSVAAVHAKAKSLGWESEHRGRPYPTKYVIPKTAKDPFRHLLSEYYAMERAKDHQQYAVLEAAHPRIANGPSPDLRWMEILKALLGFAINGEYVAMKSMAMLIDAIPNAELRGGYLAQMLDESRHVHIEKQLLRHLAKVAPDPAGYNGALRFRAADPVLRPGRALFETFLANDPVTCALGLQVITETAYTNPLFVATTEIAAANGDPITPSIFLSVQSDEARHMANGYATLAAVLSEPSNLPTVQRDLDLCFWRQHAFLDPFLAVVYDYFSSVRLRSYYEYWEEWIWEDWVGAYMDRLLPFGISRPDTAADARANVRWAGHELAAVSAALWPVHFWRTDPMTEADFAFLEEKYPGWWSRHGAFWTSYAQMADRDAGALALELLGDLPLTCRVCQMPAREVAGTALSPRVVADTAGLRHALCSDPCEEIFSAEPHRYTGRTWSEVNDGVELSEYIVREGLVRADGRTLIAQPHLHTDADRLWTVDDIRRHGVEIRDPLAAYPADKVSQLQPLCPART